MSSKRRPAEEGPALDGLTRRLAECPAEFLEEPRIGTRGQIHVDAVVSDLVVELGGEGLSQKGQTPLKPVKKSKRNHLRLMLVCSWLLHDEWFRTRAAYHGRVLGLFNESLKELAGLVKADLFVTDPDRREELVRRCLAELDLVPEGESRAAAADRLETLDSVKRQRVLADTKAQRDKARKLQEAMRKKRAAEAAARYSRE